VPGWVQIPAPPKKNNYFLKRFIKVTWSFHNIIVSCYWCLEIVDTCRISRWCDVGVFIWCFSFYCVFKVQQYCYQEEKEEVRDFIFNNFIVLKVWPREFFLKKHTHIYTCTLTETIIEKGLPCNSISAWRNFQVPLHCVHYFSNITKWV
jgi:hypothetical protein